mmetsp:Transcript_76647/g.175774  ORF Transcript_76647/g.175774 Transcript_76647/m.175774 type:complete len:539 (+) Transcript_76647:44-1660(+)
MREDQVQSAVRFLQDQRAKSAPEREQRQFMESKGLTPDEINEALRRAATQESGAQGAAGAPAQPAAPAPAPAPQPYAPTYPQYQYQPPMPYPYPPYPMPDYDDQQNQGSTVGGLLMRFMAAVGFISAAHNIWTRLYPPAPTAHDAIEGPSAERDPPRSDGERERHDDRRTDRSSTRRRPQSDFDQDRSASEGSKTPSQAERACTEAAAAMKETSLETKELISAVRALVESQQKHHQQTLDTLKEAASSLKGSLAPDVVAQLSKSVSAAFRDAGLEQRGGASPQTAEVPSSSSAPASLEPAAYLAALKRTVAQTANAADGVRLLNKVKFVMEQILKKPEDMEKRKVNMSSSRFESVEKNSDCLDFMRQAGFKQDGRALLFEGEVDHLRGACRRLTDFVQTLSDDSVFEAILREVREANGAPQSDAQALPGPQGTAPGPQVGVMNAPPWQPMAGSSPAGDSSSSGPAWMAQAQHPANAVPQHPAEASSAGYPVFSGPSRGESSQDAAAPETQHDASVAVAHPAEAVPRQEQEERQTPTGG